MQSKCFCFCFFFCLFFSNCPFYCELFWIHRTVNGISRLQIKEKEHVYSTRLLSTAVNDQLNLLELLTDKNVWIFTNARKIEGARTLFFVVVVWSIRRIGWERFSAPFPKHLYLHVCLLPCISHWLCRVADTFYTRWRQEKWLHGSEWCVRECTTFYRWSV